MKLVYSTIEGQDVTQQQLEGCSRLFNNNYGIWGRRASELVPIHREGTRVKMSPAKLRTQCLSDPKHTLLALCMDGNVIVGHGFATQWSYKSGYVCWITQLVVSSNHRRQGIASTLLRLIRMRNRSDAFGLVSSHPAACVALLAAMSGSTSTVDFKFIQDNAANILTTTPIDYLRSAELVGTAFHPSSPSPVVSSVFTNFWVDHAEPLQALDKYRRASAKNWPFGELLDGHEFLIIVRPS